MSKITTEDCKEFLIQHFNQIQISTTDKEWKRVSKYKKDGLPYRDFSHPTLGTVVVIENGSSLRVEVNEASLTQAAGVHKPAQQIGSQTVKQFVDSDIQGAQKLLKKYILGTYGDGDSDEEFDADEFFEKSLWKKYAHAIPASLTFHFPKDDYGNVPENVIAGLDSPAYFAAHSCSFSVIFRFKDPEALADIMDYEEFANDILRHRSLGKTPVPIWFDFMDEEHVGVHSGEAPENFTVRQMVETLFSLGFEYRVPEKEPCLFEHYMTQELDIHTEKQLLQDSIEVSEANSSVVKHTIKV